ncbi:hypothetical protein [Clostridium tagluense]|nr:hypothetical protein [Clostridium tagluense]
MAKNKPVFPSSNNKSSNGQESKGDNKTPVPTPKKAIGGNSRGK